MCGIHFNTAAFQHQCQHCGVSAVSEDLLWQETVGIWLCEHCETEKESIKQEQKTLIEDSEEA